MFYVIVVAVLSVACSDLLGFCWDRQYSQRAKPLLLGLLAGPTLGFSWILALLSSAIVDQIPDGSGAVGRGLFEPIIAKGDFVSTVLILTLMTIGVVGAFLGNKQIGRWGWVDRKVDHFLKDQEYEGWDAKIFVVMVVSMIFGGLFMSWLLVRRRRLSEVRKELFD